MIRVAVADDHGVLRDGLAGLIAAQPDMEVVATAADGAEAVAICRSAKPDVVLMDLEMPVMDGIEATRAILAEAPETTVLVLTSFSDRRQITGALDAGAVGYLLKDASADDVVDGIRIAAGGGSPLDPRAARSLLEAKSAPDPLAGISPREREVFALLLDGMPNKLIARRLEISEKTVKSHLTSIFRRIGVNDRVQAVLWVERQGLRSDLAPIGDWYVRPVGAWAARDGRPRGAPAVSASPSSSACCRCSPPCLSLPVQRAAARKCGSPVSVAAGATSKLRLEERQ